MAKQLRRCPWDLYINQQLMTRIIIISVSITMLYGHYKARMLCQVDLIQPYIAQYIHWSHHVFSVYSSACHEELLEANNHVQSAKHAQWKKQVSSSKNMEREIADALKVYEQEAHPSSGQMLLEVHKLYRMKVQTYHTFNLTIICLFDDCLLILCKF